jgi:hypothetical protein
MRLKVNCLFTLVLTTAVIGGLSAQGVDPGTSNLKHSWTFEDGTANDYKGGANGTLVGDASVADGSLYISGQGQWMEMRGDVIDLESYDAITLEAWYTPTQDANTGYTMLAYFGDTVGGVGVDGYFITAARGDDKSRAAISCGVYTNPWSGESGADGPEYDDGTSHLMVSTLTGDSIKLYMDGFLTGASALSPTNSIAGISPNYAYLAKSGYTADLQWIGGIQEFNIYDRALSADEILYLAGKGPAASAVDEKETSSLPLEYGLLQNYPNPFNPATNVSFDLPRKSDVHIALVDLSGREVARLVDGVEPAGRHTVQFNGGYLSSGLYICRMNVDGRILTKRMMLLK